MARCRSLGCQREATEPPSWARTAPTRPGQLPTARDEVLAAGAAQSARPQWCSEHKAELGAVSAELSTTATSHLRGGRGAAPVIVRKVEPQARRAFKGTDDELAEALIGLVALGDGMGRAEAATKLGVSAPRVKRVTAALLEDGRLRLEGRRLVVPDDESSAAQHATV